MRDRGIVKKSKTIIMALFCFVLIGCAHSVPKNHKMKIGECIEIGEGYRICQNQNMCFLEHINFYGNSSISVKLVQKYNRIGSGHCVDQ